MTVLTTLLDVLATFLRLVEAEGRAVKRAAMNVGWALAFVAVASMLILAAAGLLLVSLHQFLATRLSPSAASLLVALLAFALAGGFAAIATWWSSDRK
jgi:hypothetical protein